MVSGAWAASLRKRESAAPVYSANIPIGSATMSLSIILVIAISGALVLFGVIGVVVVLHIKKRNRARNKVRREVTEHALARPELMGTMRSIRTPEIFFPRRISRGLSFNPWITLDGGGSGIVANDWEDVDLTDHAPPLATAKRMSFHRGVIRVRESWPLASTIPLKLLPSQASMVLSPVAPPGYVVQEPKRQSTRLSRKRDSIDSKVETKFSKSSSPTRDLIPAPLLLVKNTQRRSTSDTQVPSVLRSSSQRLKAINRKSLTRTLTTIGRYPGRAPCERLLTPPMKQAAESREQLINKEFVQLMEESIRNEKLARKSLDRNSGFRLAVGKRSPTPSCDSLDSLCYDTSDVLIPAALTSPSKSSFCSEKRHKVRISEDTTVMPSSIHEDYPPSISIVEKGDEAVFFEAPHRISLAGDPFFSSVRSSKTIVSATKEPHGPRPMYFRKSTFGHEESPNRPDDYVSPLRDVSGNSQPPSPSKEPQSQDITDSSEHNPFRWSPQEAIKTRSAPLSGRTSPSKKGHRRSNVIRMSNLSLLSRRAGTVEPVKEESEEELPRKSIRFSLPPATAIRIFEPEKSPSPSSSTVSRRRSMRPPSSATFSPDLTITEGVPTTPNSSPVSKGGSQRSFSVYSPTLSVCNYYADGGGSEDEFFKPKKPSPATLKTRRHGRDYSCDLKVLSTHQEQQDYHLTLTSFPPPPGTDSIPTMTVLTPPPARPLPTITATMTGYKSLPSPALPLLTTSTPKLYGPREIPSRCSTISPPRNSLASSISMLRRMNSQLSIYSSQSTIAEESPQLPPHPHFSLSFNLEEAQAEERGRSRGSKHYLAVGRQSQHYTASGRQSQHYSRMSRAEKRDSHRIYKDRRKRKTDDFERDEKDLTPVPESSPATGSNALGIISLRFPTLSRDGINENTPPRISVLDFTAEEDIPDAKIVEMPEENKENAGSPRWSDAMTKPAKNVVRRESKMEHPSPQTPPKWTMSGLGLAGQRLLGEDKEGSPIFGNPDRPPSTGLYDQDGFLKSSPELKIAKEKAREREKRERRPKRMSDDWHCVM